VPGPDDAAALLDLVPGWTGRARIVGPLAGGITNRNFLVDVDGEPCVLRLPGKDTDLLLIDRAVEHAAAQRAAHLGIAPEVVAFVPEAGSLVTRFVAGESLPPEHLATSPWLERAGETLRAFHESGPLPGAFDCFRVPARHHADARRRGVGIPAEYEDATDRAAAIEAAFAAHPEPRCPCHDDLLNANFLRDGDRLWLLDWEYAGMNDRYFDLGNLATNNDFDAEAEVALVETYFGAATPRRLARLRLMKIMSDFREAMWGVVQQGISTLDFDYRSYAAEHFDRLLRHAADPGYGRLLDEAAQPDVPPATRA